MPARVQMTRTLMLIHSQSHAHIHSHARAHKYSMFQFGKRKLIRGCLICWKCISCCRNVFLLFGLLQVVANVSFYSFCCDKSNNFVPTDGTNLLQQKATKCDYDNVITSFYLQICYYRLLIITTHHLS